MDKIFSENGGQIQPQGQANLWSNMAFHYENYETTTTTATTITTFKYISMKF